MTGEHDPREAILAAIDGARPVTDADAFPDASSRTSDADGFDDGQPPDDPDVDWEMVRACAAEPQNDIGNARRLIRRYGTDILHLQRVGWHIWDGRRWAEDVDGRHSRPMVHRTVEAIGLEVYVIDPTEREAELIDHGREARKALAAGAAKADEAALRKAVEDGETAEKALQGRRSQRRRFANSAGNKGKIDGMMAEALPYRSRPLADMDADAFAVTVENGTLRFVQTIEEDPDCPDPETMRTRSIWRVELHPHRREDLSTKLVPVAYDPAARSPTLRGFLGRVQPKADMRDYIRRYFGYGLLGTSREQVFAIFHGEGANGKSTLVDVCCRVMGDYATSLPIATLVGDTSKRGSEATPDLARLPGARFVRTAEPKEGLPLNEEIIKTITSSEPVPIRRLHQEFVDVYPQFNLVLSTNRKPEIRGDNDGIWRRVHLVPWDVQIPPEERDRDLAEKLWAERAGILNWLIGGALDYLSGGLRAPPDVQAATEEYRAENDVIGAFIRGGVIVTRVPGDWFSPGEAFRAFQGWCAASGITPWRETTFTKRFAKAAERAGLEKAKASIVTYRGGRLHPDFAGGPPAPSSGGFTGG